MKIVLREQYLNRFTPIVGLISDLPAFQPELAAYIISALTHKLAQSWVYICVVDPGVGSDRRALVLKADERWFIGPDNGILAIIARRADHIEWWSIPTPERCSASFHARDQFAAAAAQIVAEDEPQGERIAGDDVLGTDLPDDLVRIVYTDQYGNLMTGMRAEQLMKESVINVAGMELRNARTFSDVPQGEAFWYENSIGLVELAVNCSNAAERLDLSVGDEIIIS